MDTSNNIRLEAQQSRRETPEDMLKRIFAIAEILAKAKARGRDEHPKEPTGSEKTQDDETAVS